jgi:C-terminal processing protease CtpA/Prc
MPRARRAAPDQPLPNSRLLSEFLRSVTPLPGEARYRLVEQALVLLEGAYVHLRLKRAMHGIDPVQRLRLLYHRLETLSDTQFHAELAAIFRSLRDLHTVYQLPDPYRGHVATLGFRVERYVSADGPHYLVTSVHPDLMRTSGLETGVELVAWDGIPIERAVELNADRQSGSNPDARLARGLEALTLRSLRTSTPPDEHWVIVEWRKGRSRARETRVPWCVMAAGSTAAGAAQEPVSAISGVLGIDLAAESTRQIKRELFAPEKAASAPAFALHSLLRTDTVTYRRRPYAYLRIFSFNVSGARRFLEAISRLLGVLPQNGLILDIRSNPGGSIPAAEALLQLLTPEAVEPAHFSLTTTPLALALCDSNPSLRIWSPSITAAVETGEPYSQPLPLTDPGALTDGLTRYGGPVVLVTDPLCYSAADIFAAGFQDNGIGPILGTAQRTGAGGANVWTHDLLRLWLPDSLEQLPAGTSFRVAIRRATRVRAQQGVPLEDLGVSADYVHQLTKRDIVDGNKDLIRTAAGLLASST